MRFKGQLRVDGLDRRRKVDSRDNLVDLSSVDRWIDRSINYDSFRGLITCATHKVMK